MAGSGGEGRDGFLEFAGVAEDRVVERVWSCRVCPCRVGSVEEVGVVEDGFVPDVLVGEPFADCVLVVPEAGHVRVVEEVVVDGAGGVGAEYTGPDQVDLEVAVEVFVDDVLGDPTGPGEAFASSRGGEQDESWCALVSVEGCSELVQRGKRDDRVRGTGCVVGTG